MCAFKHLLPAVLLIVCASVLHADVIHVPSQQPTIQAGIDAAATGDTVLVADGTYTGPGNRDINFFGKAIVVMSENGPENCVIDCEEDGRGFYFGNGEDSNSVLQGFTITNGGGGISCEYSSPTIQGNTITGNEDSYGGGIYCYRSSPTITGNTITGNRVGYHGGGIYCSYSSPTITGNTITGNVGTARGGGICCRESFSIITGNKIAGNHAGSGGGIDCYNNSSPTITGNTISGNWSGEGGGIHCLNSSSPTIQGNTITGNTTYGSGGGINCDDNSSPTIMGNVITENMAYVYGGGIHCWESSPTIQGNTITGNTTDVYGYGYGGGIYCYSHSSPTITSNTIVGNRTTLGGGGIYCSVFSHPTISNSILWGNSPDEIGVFQSNPVVIYSNVQGGWTGEGNIDEDPMFVQPDTTLYTDYRLLWGSLCIDSGDTALFDPDSTRSDMGAHFFDQNDYLTLYMTPDETEVAKGDQMGVTYTVINRWQQKEPFSALTRVTLPDGEVRTVLGPEDYNICPGYTVQIHLTYDIPPCAYLGMYEYQGAIGVRPSTLYDDDSFTFRVADSVWTHIEPWKPARYEDFKLLASDGATNDDFGLSVSVSGEVAIIGASGDDDNGRNSGSAYVFRYEPGTVTCFKEQKLLASDGDIRDFFGISVSISDDLALVGASGDDDNGEGSGSAYVFRYDPGAETWIEEAKLLASDGDSDDSFGLPVSVSGDVAVIGANNDEDNGEWSGSAYVFRYDPNTETWTEEEKLLASDGAYNDDFGSFVSVSGEVAVIGAPSDDDNGVDSGSAYVFRYDPNTQAWIEEEKLIASDGVAGAHFSPCSVSGDIAVIGASRDNENGHYAGAAYVFRYDAGPETWIEEEKLLASDGVGQDHFGKSVSVFGDVAVIGANEDDDYGEQSGSAYVFRYDSVTETWIEIEKLLASEGAAGDWFGRSVSVSGDGAVIGANRDDDNGNRSGSAYVFQLEID